MVNVCDIKNALDNLSFVEDKIKEIKVDDDHVSLYLKDHIHNIDEVLAELDTVNDEGIKDVTISRPCSELGALKMIFWYK